MIRYTVVWHEDAQNQLAQIWLDADDRPAVTETAHVIDSDLAVDAHEKGTQVEADLRQLVVAPLRVLFVASEPDRMSRVVHVVRT